MDIFIQQHSGHFALIWISILVHWPFAFNKNSSKANKTPDSQAEAVAVARQRQSQNHVRQKS